MPLTPATPALSAATPVALTPATERYDTLSAEDPTLSKAGDVQAIHNTDNKIPKSDQRLSKEDEADAWFASQKPPKKTSRNDRRKVSKAKSKKEVHNSVDSSQKLELTSGKPHTSEKQNIQNILLTPIPANNPFILQDDLQVSDEDSKKKISDLISEMKTKHSEIEKKLPSYGFILNKKEDLTIEQQNLFNKEGFLDNEILVLGSRLKDIYAILKQKKISEFGSISSKNKHEINKECSRLRETFIRFRVGCTIAAVNRSYDEGDINLFLKCKLQIFDTTIESLDTTPDIQEKYYNLDFLIYILIQENHLERGKSDGSLDNELLDTLLEENNRKLLKGHLDKLLTGRLKSIRNDHQKSMVLSILYLIVGDLQKSKSIIKEYEKYVISCIEDGNPVGILSMKQERLNFLLLCYGNIMAVVMTSNTRALHQSETTNLTKEDHQQLEEFTDIFSEINDTYHNLIGGKVYGYKVQKECPAGGYKSFVAVDPAERTEYIKCLRSIKDSLTQTIEENEAAKVNHSVKVRINIPNPKTLLVPKEFKENGRFCQGISSFTDDDMFYSIPTLQMIVNYLEVDLVFCNLYDSMYHESITPPPPENTLLTDLLKDNKDRLRLLKDRLKLHEASMHDEQLRQKKLANKLETKKDSIHEDPQVNELQKDGSNTEVDNNSNKPIKDSYISIMAGYNRSLKTIAELNVLDRLKKLVTETKQPEEQISCYYALIDIICQNVIKMIPQMMNKNDNFWLNGLEARVRQGEYIPKAENESFKEFTIEFIVSVNSLKELHQSVLEYLNLFSQAIQKEPAKCAISIEILDELVTDISKADTLFQDINNSIHKLRNIHKLLREKIEIRRQDYQETQKKPIDSAFTDAPLASNSIAIQKDTDHPPTTDKKIHNYVDILYIKGFEKITENLPVIRAVSQKKRSSQS